MSEHENPPPTPPEVWVARDYFWPAPGMRWTRGGSWWCRLMHKRWYKMRVWYTIAPDGYFTTQECHHCPPGRI